MTTDRTPVVLVTGMPGAGKTTVTTLAAQHIPRAARLSGDVVSRLIVSGRVGFQQEPVAEFDRQVVLLNRNLCSLAANFADAGFTPLIDSVIPDRRQLDQFIDLLAPRPIHLIVLAPGGDVCTYRNTIRHPDERFDFDGYDHLDTTMRTAYGDLGWWFDTSTLDAETTARRVVEEGEARGLLT